jgi:peptidoglycan hydrolase-like protein with peptidoglycan-binding domain
MNEEREQNIEAVVQDEAPAAAAPVETVAEVKVEAEQPKPSPKPAPVPAAKHVVSGADKDEVHLKQCVYKNPYARKSLTIHHLQRRLAELGYDEAAADRDGWYGDLTKAAVAAYQKDNKLDGNGVMNAKTFETIFAGDPNVRVNV